MKAAVLKSPQTLRVENVSKPKADNDFLIVEVKACGICGSDVRYYEGENPWALHTLGKMIPNPPNIIFGHEFAGVVHEVANPDFKYLMGRRVSVLAFNTCGVCEYCRANLYHLCAHTMHLGHGAGWGKRDYFPGGMAEYCEVWNTHVVELPETVSFEEATLIDPISVAIHAITQSELRPGEDVLVIGTGAVGLSIAQAVRAFGVRKVITTDIYEATLKIARENGVDHAVDALKTDIEQFVKEQYGSVNVVFDTVGSQTTQRQSFNVLKEAGRIVNLVANTTKASYRLTDLAGEKKIITTANNRYEDYLLGLTLIENGTINAKAMITSIVTLDEVKKGFDLLLDKSNSQAVKVVVRP